jgi:hypothetical protein
MKNGNLYGLGVRVERAKENAGLVAGVELS